MLVEAFEPVALCQDDEFPLEFRGIPISYFSLNDFLNLTVQLRTAPEIAEYFDTRRALPAGDLRVVGEERSLFAFNLLNGGSFVGCLGIPDVKIAVAAQAERFEAILSRKLDSDRYSELMEHVANELATRLSDYAVGLTPRLLDGFDPPERRRKYIEMQRVLADLRLRERAELGRAFASTVERLRNESQGFIYRAMRLDTLGVGVCLRFLEKHRTCGTALTTRTAYARCAGLFQQGAVLPRDRPRWGRVRSCTFATGLPAELNGPSGRTQALRESADRKPRFQPRSIGRAKEQSSSAQFASVPSAGFGHWQPIPEWKN